MMKLLLLITFTVTLSLSGEPLKVYILAGQSNMEGHAKIETFDYIGKDPKTAPMLKEMRNADGTPKICDDVWISYYTGGKSFGEGHGKLTAGYGSVLVAAPASTPICCRLEKIVDWLNVFSVIAFPYEK